ncbi:MAG TPA: outer membrane protein assembly factor BamE [Planctomycetota bacterium]|nr:outer membrane protein assembly factor BamE [Planctomycetota bacterium]
MKTAGWAVLGILAFPVAGCGSHGSKESHAVVLHWDAELYRRLGTATQSDIQALMGEPTVRDLIGEAEVWVYQYGSDDRAIKPEVKLVAPKHDELILSFDRGGTLQKYTVVAEGRSSQRQRGR